MGRRGYSHCIGRITVLPMQREHSLKSWIEKNVIKLRTKLELINQAEELISKKRKKMFMCKLKDKEKDEKIRNEKNVKKKKNSFFGYL